MKRIASLGCCAVLVLLTLPTRAQTSPQPNSPTAPAAQPVPVLDGGAGPCSVEFTITTADGKPAEAAKVKVHIAYGFWSFHRLDLEASTNSDGRVKFTGLPSHVRRSQLEFDASKDQSTGTALVDPLKECQAQREIKLAEKPAAAQ